MDIKFDVGQVCPYYNLNLHIHYLTLLCLRNKYKDIKVLTFINVDNKSKLIDNYHLGILNMEVRLLNVNMNMII